MEYKKLKHGDFIRVRKDHSSPRAGKDGMVREDYGRSVSLYFGYDRFNEPQNCLCVGPELWHKAELDFNTVTS